MAEFTEQKSIKQINPIKPTVIILHADKCWENDFIHYDLFPDLPIFNVSYSKYHSLKTTKDFEEFFLDNNIEFGNNILIFSSNRNMGDVWRMIDIAPILKPIIMLHLSDEFGIDKSAGYKEAYNTELSKYTKLLLRHYHHTEHKIDTYDNIDCLPLGYTNGMITQSSLTLPVPKHIYKRKYFWSFLGFIRDNREEMVEVFKNSKTGDYICKNDAGKLEMYEIYQDTVFVPIGRGNKVLDCFRIYEALIAGAIPVIVGPKQEMEDCFKYENNPPWIFAESWTDALIECKRLYKNKKELTQKQFDMGEHWKNRILSIRQKIQSVIDDSN